MSGPEKGLAGKPVGGRVENPPVHHSPSNDYGHWAPNEAVHVFYRYEYDGSGDGPDAYFPVRTESSGQCLPRIGATHCWQPAVVVDRWHPSMFDPLDPINTGVNVRLSYPTWYNRQGCALDVRMARNCEIRIHPADVVRGTEMPATDISFVVVRWGGLFKTPDYNDLGGEEGGWGSIGTSISDGYITAMFDRAYQRLGPTYEVITCFVQGSADMGQVTPNAIVPLLRGRRFAGCYFLWPIAFTEGTCRTPGYVEKESLFSVMRRLECGGVPTAFPHPSYLYRTLVSKDWCQYVCLLDSLHVPATTRVSRARIAANAEDAAANAIASLTSLSDQSVITGGVAKLAYSWEASDVFSFRTKQQLAANLGRLVSQPGCESEYVIVQQFVPSDLEIRAYCISGEPVHLLYTKFCEHTEEGSFTAFQSVSRDTAVGEWFGGCDIAMAHAEAEVCRLTHLWMRWVRGIDSHFPPFLRLDYFVKRVGNESKVMTGELTEMGASCLGWADGWTATFDAVLKAAGDVPFPSILAPLSCQRDYEERDAKRARYSEHADPTAHPSIKGGKRKGAPHGFTPSPESYRVAKKGGAMAKGK
ncbi:hypothetical protein DIPPA_24965 [Diplonema papillatum]|nr:hypothetical protein DIPPA_24965 [Diplonema papillatum]